MYAIEVQYSKKELPLYTLTVTHTQSLSRCVGTSRDGMERNHRNNAPFTSYPLPPTHPPSFLNLAILFQHHNLLPLPSLFQVHCSLISMQCTHVIIKQPRSFLSSGMQNNAAAHSLSPITKAHTLLLANAGSQLFI